MLSLFIPRVSAQKIEDASTQPDKFYLLMDEAPVCADFMPAPPDEKSALFINDQVRYFWGKSIRETPRGEQAKLDADLDAEGLFRAFSEPFGYTISDETTPELCKLIRHTYGDVRRMGIKQIKERYMRIRPYVYYNEGTCYPGHEDKERNTGSYPSGHSARGWGFALILAEINTPRQNEILQKGFELGESRVICGYHYQSDVEASRVIVSTVIARLHANEAFCKQLEKAKKEFKKLEKAGKIAKSEKYPLAK
ncbi:MAG TPA: acid phosphatase [Porphyromonadaceae bacterium]|nr:acid phosphatase [Porphyromonadaceae bacterium]